MNTWTETMLENESDAQGQMAEACPYCGLAQVVHYRHGKGAWIDCRTQGHTPTPWQVDGQDGAVVFDNGRDALYPVAHCVGPRADAALIVIAVNAHDALTADVLRLKKKLGVAFDALIEVRQEIARLNRAAGETIFNPASTQLVEEAISTALRDA